MKNNMPESQLDSHEPESFRDHEQQLRLMIASVKDYAIFMLDPGGHIVSWNTGAEQIKGYKEKEIIGKHFSIFYPSKDIQNQKPERELTEAIAKGRLEDEGWRIRKDGTRFWANVVITPVYDEAGILRGFSKVTRDLTERKNGEDMLRQTQDQLLNTNRMGAMARLASGIAQEFDGLTKTIARQAKFLISSLDENNPLRPRVEEIKKIAEDASILTGQLLAFSSNQILNPKLLDLNIVITSIRGTLQWLIGKDMELVTKLSPMIGWVSIDPFQMENVLINLAGRAREAMQPGGKFTLETANIEVNSGIPHINGIIPAGKYVRLSIGDTGTGMPREIQARIFEPYFKPDDKVKEAGLRLSTVYGIIMQSGGHIMVNSEANRGTTFDIYLNQAEKI
jgi:PAS domain S-box-containing protein